MKKLIAASSLVTIAAALFLTLPLAADDTKPSKGDHHKACMECAKECGQCAMACDACSAHCVKMLAEGKKEHLKTAQTCQDCAAICGTAACVTAKGGPFADIICTACAEACKRCCEACEAGSADPMMKKCADQCRQCEKACRMMGKNAAATTH